MTSPALDQLPFTIQNLPYGIISTIDEPSPRCAVAVGKHAIDLVKYTQDGKLSKVQPDAQFEQIFDQVCHINLNVKYTHTDETFQPTLNAFATLPWSIRKEVRHQIQSDLKDGNIGESCLVLLSDVLPHLPMKMGGFSDFYTSLDHCKNW